MQEVKKNFLLKSDLKNQGWTDGLIDKYLGEPDLRRKRPGGGTYCLYAVDRVQSVEETEEFKAYIEKNAARREKARHAGKARAEEKRQALLRHVNSLVIEIPHYGTKAALFTAAINHYNDRNEYSIASVNDNEEFLARIATNMLRHSCDVYEEQLEKLFGKVGREEAYLTLKHRVNQAIADKYPFLLTGAPEARTQ